MRTRWVSAALSVALAATGWAEKATTRVEGIDARGFPEVVATVRVEATGDATRKTARDFRVQEDGADVGDLHVEVDARPVYLSLVLDESGSMRGAMPQLKRAALDFLEAMGEQAHCQLVTFATRVTRHTDFLRDTRPVRRAVAGLQAKGATRLYDAMAGAVKELAGFPPDVRRVVVVFTDGRDERSKNGPQLSQASARSVAKAAVAYGVPLYFVGLGKHVQVDLLKKFASVTGGEAHFTEDPARLRQAFTRMASTVRRSYRLRYRTPRPEEDGSKRVVGVTARHPKSGDEHFKGWYRAPQQLVADARPRPGCAAHRKVVGTLRGLKRYRVDATGVTSTAEGAGAAAPVETRVRVARAGDAQDVSVRLGGASGGLAVRVQQDGDRSVVRIGGGSGETLVTQVDRQAAVRLGADPVGRVFSWLGADASAQEGSESCRDYHLVRPGVLQLADRGTLRYDRKSYLPLSLVTVDAATGASTSVRFGSWVTGRDVVVDVPKARALSAEAQLFAGRVAGEALGVAGAALRTGVAAGHLGLLAGALGAQAGVAGAQAGVAGARAGLAGTRAGLAGARVGLAGAQVGLAGAQVGLAAAQLVSPYRAEVAAAAIQRAGALVQVVSSEAFARAVAAPGEAAGLWAQAATDEAWARSLEQAADDYGAAMDQWGEDLDAALTADARALEAAGVATGLAAEALGAQAELLGAEAEVLGAHAEAMGRAAEAATIDLDAAGRDVDAAGRDLDAAGRDLDAMGTNLGNLGDRLGKLGDKLGQLGDLGGDW